MKLTRPAALSLRYKIPVRVITLVLITAFTVTASMVFRMYDEIRRDLVAHSAGLGRVLAGTLTAPIIHDDLWRAYEVVSSPQRHDAGEFETLATEIVVVLDPEFRTFVSTQPTRYPLGINPAQLEADFTQIQQVLGAADIGIQRLIEPPQSGSIYMVTPIVADGVLLGRLVLGYSRQVFIPRLNDLVTRSVLATLAVLLVLLPLSVWWARKLADPLVALAQAMDKMAVELPDPEKIPALPPGDEIGRLAKAFRTMLIDLREKEQIEQQMLVSERLAAVGRLSAGIAHEINNPLGGMLNALSTFRRHGAHDALTEKTASLLERGLTQIKDTVAALLVETQVASHLLAHEDIEDIRILISVAVSDKSARLVWRNQVSGTLPFSSTQVRQVLLNLLQNAVQAIEHGGLVECNTYVENDHLMIVVENDGSYIPKERLPFLFEPFTTGRAQGNGLGLWVTYQIVKQLKGGLDVDSHPGLTRFVIDLPFPEST